MLDEPTMSDQTLLLSVEDLINLAMGPIAGNTVDFKMLKTILHILARQMRLLEQKVVLEVGELPQTPVLRQTRRDQEGSQSTSTESKGKGVADSKKRRQIADIREERIDLSLYGDEGEESEGSVDSFEMEERREEAQRARDKDIYKALKAEREKERAKVEREKMEKMDPTEREVYQKELQKEQEQREKAEKLAEEEEERAEKEARAQREKARAEREKVKAEKSRLRLEKEKEIAEKEREIAERGSAKMEKMSPSERTEYKKQLEKEKEERMKTLRLAQDEEERVEKEKARAERDKARAEKEKERDERERAKMENMTPREKESYQKQLDKVKAEREEERRKLEKMDFKEREQYEIAQHKERERVRFENMNPDEKKIHEQELQKKKDEKEKIKMEKMSPEEREYYKEEKEKKAKLEKMSPKEREKYEKEQQKEIAAKAEKEKEKLAKMSPKEREKYEKQQQKEIAEKEQAKLDKMSPKEREKYQKEQQREKEEAEKEKEKLAKMSPKEREKYEKQQQKEIAEKEQAKVEKMSPKEREKYQKEQQKEKEEAEKEKEKLAKMSPKEREKYEKEKQKGKADKDSDKSEKEQAKLDKMSPKEREKYQKEQQKEKEEAEKEKAKLAKMSPKEREKYEKQQQKEIAEKEQAKLDKMSPKEREKYQKEQQKEKEEAEKEKAALAKMSPKEREKYEKEKQKDTSDSDKSEKEKLAKMSPKEREKYEKEQQKAKEIAEKQAQKELEKEKAKMDKMSPQEREKYVKEKEKAEKEARDRAIAGDSAKLSDVVESISEKYDTKLKEKVLVVEKGPSGRGSEPRSRRSSIEVVTRSQFALLEAAVESLRENTGPLPALTLPENDKLRTDLAKGNLSLTDAMTAMQVSARVQAAEQAIGRLGGVLTQLAGQGLVPDDEAGARAGDEGGLADGEGGRTRAPRAEGSRAQGKATPSMTSSKSVHVKDPGMSMASRTSGVSTITGMGLSKPSIISKGPGSMALTQYEMDAALDALRKELMEKVNAITSRALSSAETTSSLAKSVVDKMDVALKIDDRISTLNALVSDYTEQLAGFDAGLTTQMQSFREQMTQMRGDLTAGLALLESANNNAETAAMMELTERYEELVNGLDNTLLAHQALAAFQDQLNLDCRSLLESVEMLREQKADRDEVIDGLRDKADNERLAGLLREEDFNEARADLDQRLAACYDKFRKQDAVWVAALKDVTGVVQRKAEHTDLMKTRQDTTKQLQEIDEKIKRLAFILGEPKAAILTRKLAKDAVCAVCLVPAVMDPQDATTGKPPLLPSARASRARGEGAAPAPAEQPCAPEWKPPEAPDLRTHTCLRWVGGSHTLLSAATRGHCEPPAVPPTIMHKFVGQGDDGKMYLMESELEPCEPCNPPLHCSEGGPCKQAD